MNCQFSFKSITTANVSLLVGITLAGISITTQANAFGLHPISYDMPNGETGWYTYHDDTYNGSGLKYNNLAPLSGGLGKLTDGTIAISSWNVTPNLYVGWLTTNPTINFHFGSQVTVNSLTIYTDSYWSVLQPSSVNISNGKSTFNSGLLTDKSGPTSYTFSGLNFTGQDLDLTLNRRQNLWIQLSEVKFEGEVAAVPEPLTILGTGVVLSALPVLKKEYAKKKKKKDGDT